MKTRTWAEMADDVLADVFGDDPTFVPGYRTLAAAFPWTPRAMWPYKAWLARRRAWLFARKLGFARPLWGPGESHPRPDPIDPCQLEMFA